MQKIKIYLVSLIVRGAMECIGSTCRIQIISGQEIFQKIVDDKKPVIFSFWHNRIFFLSFFLYKYCHRKGLPLCVLISQSADGDFISGIVESWKGRTVRGSSSRGGFGAIKGLIKSVREGYAIVTTPDGPRGPKYVFKEGSIYIASVAQIPVVPVSCSFEKAWVLRSWDNFMIPKPFSKILVSIGEPQIISRDISAGQLPPIQKQMEKILNEMPEFAKLK